MSTTQAALRAEEPSTPDQEPDNRGMVRTRGSVRALVRPLPPQPGMSPKIVVGSEHGARAPALTPFKLTRDEGVWIVEDLLGAVHGTGSSIEQALDDFHTALREHLEFLRNNQARLHGRLARQLIELQELFPGL